MTTKKLKLIPIAKIKPDKMSILAQPSDAKGPLMVGEEATDPTYVCGSCGNPLLVGVAPGSLTDMVLHCKCGAYNEGAI
jgi:hypothetical protein